MASASPSFPGGQELTGRRLLTIQPAHVEGLVFSGGVILSPHGQARGTRVRRLPSWSFQRQGADICRAQYLLRPVGALRTAAPGSWRDGVGGRL